MAVTPVAIDFIRIDINSGKVRKAVSALYKDSTRTLNITLADAGNSLDLSDVLFAEILITKTDGTETDSGCVIVGDTVQYTLTSNDLGALGSNTAQIMLTYSDGTVLTTPPFEINVYSKVLDQNVQKSTNDYTALAQQVALAKSYVESIGDAVEQSASSAASAAASAANASEFAISAAASASKAVATASQAQESATTAALSEANATNSANESKSYYDKVEAKATEILNLESKAEEYANASAASATESANSATASAASATKASTSAKNASVSEANASTSEDNTAALEANTKHYYEQVVQISESLSGALKPMGTVTYNNLPTLSDATAGDMYNISDEFTTTAEFKEGTGIVVPAGSNIYKTSDNYWDVLAGSPVAGVRGSAEESYRTGNVEITADNLGLHRIATTGSFNDLEDVPTETTETFLILNNGFPTQTKIFSDDGTTITATSGDSDTLGWTLTKVFTDSFLTCTTTLKDAGENIKATLIKQFSADGKTISTVYNYEG